MPSAQAPAFLEVGQPSGDACLGSCVLSLGQRLNVLLVGPLMGLVKAQPCRELDLEPEATRPGLSRAQHAGAGSTEGDRACGRMGGLARTFFNKCKSYARASLMSCIRISPSSPSSCGLQKT